MNISQAKFLYNVLDNIVSGRVKLGDSGGNTTSLVKASDIIFAKGVSAKEAGRELALLDRPDQALVLHRAFSELLLGVGGKDIHNESQRAGRRIENILIELERPEETLHELIEAGDIELVLNVIRGNAGEYSAMAEYLTPELVGKVFESDPDGHTASRRVTLAYTFICETSPDNVAVNDFFNESELGQLVLATLYRLRESDVDAQNIVDSALMRGIRLRTELVDESVSGDESDDGADDDECEDGHIEEGLHVEDEYDDLDEDDDASDWQDEED